MPGIFFSFYCRLHSEKNYIIAAIRYMKKIFEILPSSIDPGNCILICEVSNEGFSFTIRDEGQNLFMGLGVYHFDKVSLPGDSLEALLQGNEFLSGNFKKVVLVYSFSESVLIPFPLYDSEQNAEVLNLVHGDMNATDSLLTDVITEESMYNSFRVPAALYHILQRQFPKAVSQHQYSVLLRQKLPDRNQLSIIFYTGKMVVSVVKDGKHQLINSFNYRTEQEVTYILLNICNQFDIENIDVEISGLLEKSSALYKEIYKYFDTIGLTPLPENKNYIKEITEHPAHYFSHIFALDLCE